MKKPAAWTYNTRLLSLTLVVVVLGGVLLGQIRARNAVAPEAAQSPAAARKDPVEPTLEMTVLLGGLLHPWEVAFLPDKTLLFTERSGTLSALVDGVKKEIARLPGLYTLHESGLMGLAVDADFNNNRFVYTCFNTNSEVRLARWKLSADVSTLTDRTDIITGIPSNPNGYHSGCRIKVARDGTLWIGTGDAYRAGVAQDPTSLGGKVLHVTRDGAPVEGNMSAPFDARIFNYGHRNVQGLMLYDKPTKDGSYGLSIEHGSNVDDEINLIKAGNFGWAPTVTYVQDGVPMTDLKKFPEAISAIWSSGGSTIAPSGGTLLSGEQWGTWNGAVGMAVLKGKEVRVIKFTSDNSLEFEKTIINNIGRVRTAVQGPGGSLYVATDNGSNDQILKITPKGN